MNLKKFHPNKNSFIQYGRVQIGSLQLESGLILENVEIAYERTGAGTKAPVIVVCHALTGNQAAVGTNDQPGWWHGLIGPDSYIDANEFQIITMNVLGGCSGTTGPTSKNPKTGYAYQGDFPLVTVRDMVRAQYIALKKLGIEDVKAVVGGSLGGMQAYEWAIMYPSFSEYVIIMAATPYLSDYGIAFNTIGRQAIINDPEWAKGFYKEGAVLKGLEIARMAGMITYRSDGLFNRRFQRDKRTDTLQFQIESYLTYQGKKLAKRFDANSYLTLLQAMDHHDIRIGRGGLRAALKQINAKVIAFSYKGDLLYPPKDIRCVVDEMKKLGKQAEYHDVDTEFGHDGFLVEFEKWGPVIKNALQNPIEREVSTWLSK